MYRNGILSSGGEDWRDLEVMMAPSLLQALKVKSTVSGMVPLYTARLNTIDHTFLAVNSANSQTKEEKPPMSLAVVFVISTSTS
jgi:hypothetical protein